MSSPRARRAGHYPPARRCRRVRHHRKPGGLLASHYMDGARIGRRGNGSAPPGPRRRRPGHPRRRTGRAAPQAPGAPPRAPGEACRPAGAPGNHLGAHRQATPQAPGGPPQQARRTPVPGVPHRASRAPHPAGGVGGQRAGPRWAPPPVERAADRGRKEGRASGSPRHRWHGQVVTAEAGRPAAGGSCATPRTYRVRPGIRHCHARSTRAGATAARRSQSHRQAPAMTPPSAARTAPQGSVRDFHPAPTMTQSCCETQVMSYL